MLLWSTFLSSIRAALLLPTRILRFLLQPLLYSSGLPMTHHMNSSDSPRLPSLIHIIGLHAPPSFPALLLPFQSHHPTHLSPSSLTIPVLFLSLTSLTSAIRLLAFLFFLFQITHMLFELLS